MAAIAPMAPGIFPITLPLPALPSHFVPILVAIASVLAQIPAVLCNVMPVSAANPVAVLEEVPAILGNVAVVASDIAALVLDAACVVGNSAPAVGVVVPLPGSLGGGATGEEQPGSAEGGECSTELCWLEHEILRSSRVNTVPAC